MLLVTGLSGAGKSVALNALEDSGCETVDNMPLSLIPLLLSAEENTAERMVVVGCDIRSRNFSIERFSEMLHSLQAHPKHQVEMLFLTADDDVLQRRYTETRRKHPLAADRPVLAGIRRERKLLTAIRNQADEVIDTSKLKAADFRQFIRQKYAIEGQGDLSLHIQSFSFKKGVPREADMLFDVRFLRNPYYDVSLRPQDGRNEAVAEYIRQDEAFAPFFEHLTVLLAPLLPRYEQEGKSYLTIAIGCTGGQHRSVFVAERLATYFEQTGYVLHLNHRDLTIV